MNSSFWCFLLMFIITYSQNRVTATNEIKSKKVPSSVLEASSFITDFHKKKFAANAFDKISVPYLSSINEEDIADLSFLNTMSSIFSSSFVEPITTNNDVVDRESNNESNSSSLPQQPQPLPSPKQLVVDSNNDTDLNDTSVYKNLGIDNETLSFYMTMRRKKKTDGYIVIDNLRLQCNKYDYIGSPTVELVEIMEVY